MPTGSAPASGATNRALAVGLQWRDVSQDGGSVFRKRVFRAEQIYKTDLLPGFELPLARLFALADRWPSED